MVVEEAYFVSNGNVDWSINVNGNLNDWELGKYDELLQILAGQQIADREDRKIGKE